MSRLPMILCPACLGHSPITAPCNECGGRNVVMKPQHLWTDEERASVAEDQRRQYVTQREGI